ncbi:hypothetical protein P8605_33830, partial [Streptomyces sp. T-3]|nr:hypothetical protein [Streptomyces sp. T-3]
ACLGCAVGRMSVGLTRFAALGGHGLRAAAGPGAAPAQEEPGVPELVAEAALLQARLDWFQSQLARLRPDT